MSDAAANVNTLPADLVQPPGGDLARDARERQRWAEPGNHNLAAVRVARDHKVNSIVRLDQERDIRHVRNEQTDVRVGLAKFVNRTSSVIRIVIQLNSADRNS